MIMAIKSNKKIDFEYEHENDGEVYAISLRLHNSVEYGASIGVLDENGDVAINFPVAMFSEITDFLIDQGVIESKRIIANAPVKLPKPNKPNVASQNKPVTLPKPRLVNNKVVNPLRAFSVNQGNKQSDMISVDLENDDGNDYSEYPEEIQQQLKSENMRIQNLNSAIDGIEPTLSLHSAATQNDLSEEDIASIMAERQSAVNRQSETKKIRKK